MEIGRCHNSEGKMMPLGKTSDAIKLDDIDDKGNERLMECFKKCRGVPLASGCELFSGVSKKRNGCYAHTGDVTFGRVPVESRSKPEFRACWVFSKCSDGEYLNKEYIDRFISVTLNSET